MKKIELDKSKPGIVDLKYDGKKITDFGNCVESYSFWEDVERDANRAMFQIKKENPKIDFDFYLRSMMTTPEERREVFLEFLNKKHPEVDGKLVCDLIDEEVSKIELTGDENHPNPFLKFEVNSDFIKAFFVSVISKYEKRKKTYTRFQRLKEFLKRGK